VQHLVRLASLTFFWRITRSRNNREDYEDASFVEDVDENFVDFHDGGKKREIFDDITVAQARWPARLSPGQIRDAFSRGALHAGGRGYPDESCPNRIDQLVKLPNQFDSDRQSRKSDHPIRRE
jgi:hypothetical protein